MGEIIQTTDDLLNYVDQRENLDAIVVEGYDGVGKGRVLESLSQHLGVVPYRPDYNLWQKYDHRNIDRWKVSGFFWDIYSHFYKAGEGKILLFDRGILSGSVYNNDARIAKDYKTLLRDMRVLHVLVTCDKSDYYEFQKIRGIHLTEIDYEWLKYLEYTQRYKEAISISDVDCIEYVNHYDKSIRYNMETTCAGCGHYNYGWCRHPDIDKEVDKTQERCMYSNDKETQDRRVEDASEMHSL